NAVVVRFSPDGRRLVSWADDGTTRSWDVPPIAPPERILAGHLKPVNSALFSKNGHDFVTAGQDGTIRLWNLQTGNSRVVATYLGTTFKAIFPMDGIKIASCGYRQLQVWNNLANRGQVLEPAATIFDMAFSP